MMLVSSVIVETLDKVKILKKQKMMMKKKKLMMMMMVMEKMKVDNLIYDYLIRKEHIITSNKGGRREAKQVDCFTSDLRRRRRYWLII